MVVERQVAMTITKRTITYFLIVADMEIPTKIIDFLIDHVMHEIFFLIVFFLIETNLSSL